MWFTGQLGPKPLLQDSKQMDSDLDVHSDRVAEPQESIARRLAQTQRECTRLSTELDALRSEHTHSAAWLRADLDVARMSARAIFDAFDGLRRTQQDRPRFPQARGSQSLFHRLVQRCVRFVTRIGGFAASSVRGPRLHGRMESAFVCATVRGDTLAVEAIDTTDAVWCTALSASRADFVLLDWRWMSAMQPQSQPAPDPVWRTARATAGRPIMLISARECGGTGGRAEIRRIRGEPCILKFDLAEESSPPLLHDPTEAKRHTMWRAQELARHYTAEEVVAYASAVASRQELAAVRLLRANFAHGNDAYWLECVNGYLAERGATPVALSSGNQSRFLRLSPASMDCVDSGPLVSVIMPAYNAQATLEHAARSMLRQTWRNVELIIVDDCSQDETAAIATRLANMDRRVKVLRNSVNVGPYVSKNRALVSAQGEFITGHDADDWAHPQRLEAQWRAMRAHEGGAVAGLAGMLRMDEAGVFTMTKQGEASADGVLRVAPISCMLDAQYLRNCLGSWDSVRFGADGEFIGRLRATAARRVCEVPLMAMICLDAPGSLTNDPVHGVLRDRGISASRREYRDSWRTWHRTLSENSAVLPFPAHERFFDAPKALEVPLATVLAAVEEQAR